MPTGGRSEVRQAAGQHTVSGSSGGWCDAGVIISLLRRWVCLWVDAAGRLGLRREELASLAGISADYLTRLEQGRATSPSPQVVDALARALRLADAERDLLYCLAGHAAPGLDVVPSRVTASVQRLLD